MPTSPRVALVTGSGAKRVGQSIAFALAQRGFSLVLHYRHSKDEAEQALITLRRQGVRTIAVGADLTQEEEVQLLFEQTVSEFGRLDVLVNAAADWSPKPLEEVRAADVRHFFEANTLSTFLCCQKAGLVMVGQPDGGCIITIGDWAIVRPYRHYAAYFPSKGAIPTMTRSLAVELGTRNPKVRVNCIEPGPVMLPANLPESDREAAIGGTLVQREGEPGHVAQAVLALVENDFITGACLTVDGGRSIFAAGD